MYFVSFESTNALKILSSCSFLFTFFKFLSEKKILETVPCIINSAASCAYILFKPSPWIFCKKYVGFIDRRLMKMWKISQKSCSWVTGKYTYMRTNEQDSHNMCNHDRCIIFATYSKAGHAYTKQPWCIHVMFLSKKEHDKGAKLLKLTSCHCQALIIAAYFGFPCNFKIL